MVSEETKNNINIYSVSLNDELLNNGVKVQKYKQINLTFPLSSEDNSYTNASNVESILSQGKAYKITLKEGLSAPFEARVSVVFTNVVDINVMQEMLAKLVSIELVRESSVLGKHIPSRYLTGVVLSYTYDGVVATSQRETDANSIDFDTNSSDSTDYYSYTFTITSRLQAMALNKRTRTYVNISEDKNGILSLVDVIKTLFQEYPRVTCDVSKIVDKYKHFNKQSVIYQQIDESDLDFLNRLCLIYGINYSVYYDPTNYKEKIVFSCDFDFSNNENNEVNTDNKKYVLDFKNGTDSEVSCEVDYKKNSGSDDNYLLHRAQFDQSVCLSLKLNENADYQDNKSYKDFEVIKNLYLSSRLSQNEITDEETNIIKQSYLGLLNNTSNRFIAKTSDFVFVPGLILNIKDYFGAGKAARLLVVRTILSFKLKINGVYVDSKENVEESGIEQQVLAIKCEPNTVLGAFCNYPMLVSTVLSATNTTTEDAFTTISRKYKNQVASITNNVLSNYQSRFFIGTVCNEKGLDYEMEGNQKINLKGKIVCNKDSFTSKSSLIYVTISGQSKPIVAQCVFNNGSNFDFVSCLPRVGQKVLVVSVDGVFLVQGVLPSNDGLDVVFSGYDDALQNSCLIIQDKNLQDRTLKQNIKSDKESTRNNMIGFISFKGLTNQIVFLILQGLIDNYIQKVALLINSNDLLTVYKNKYKNDCEKIAKKISDEQSKGAVEEISKQYANLEEQAKNIIKLILNYEAGRNYLKTTYGIESSKTSDSYDFTDKSVKYSTLISQDSNETSLMSNSGEITISANKNISITAGGKITLSAKDGIDIIDEKGVSISVGRSLQSITQDEIVLSQKAWHTLGDPFESSLSLNSVKGASMVGPGVDIQGKSYVSISDELGSQIFQGYGGMSLSGTNVEMTTTTIPRFVNSGLNLIADLTEMIGTTIEEDRDSKITDEYIVPYLRAFGAVSKYGGAACQRILEYKNNKPRTTRDKIAFGVNLITDIIYTIEAILDQIIDTIFNEVKKGVEKKIKELETKQDELTELEQKELKELKEKLPNLREDYNIVKTTEYCLNLIVGLAGVFSVYISAGKYRVSNLTVGPNQVSCNTRKIMESSERNLTVLSAGAGKVALQQAGGERQHS